MLNNTEYKSQPEVLDEVLESQALVGMNAEDGSAANASQFDQTKSDERRLRRERRYRRNRSLSSVGWRVTTW